MALHNSVIAADKAKAAATWAGASIFAGWTLVALAVWAEAALAPCMATPLGPVTVKVKGDYRDHFEDQGLPVSRRVSGFGTLSNQGAIDMHANSDDMEDDQTRAEGRGVLPGQVASGPFEKIGGHSL